MDNLASGMQEKKATKKTKIKKKPLKVVYISNPIKVSISASEFRALVQELTGRDAELPDPTRIVGSDEVDGNQTVPDAPRTVDDHGLEVPLVDPGREQPQRSDAPIFESFDDDVFMPQMLENFPGLMPTSFLFESTNVDVLRGLDAM